MDIEKLIDRKDRLTQTYAAYSDLSLAHALYDAATALSTLQAENEKLRAEADGMRSNWYKAVEEVKNLRTELDEKEKYYDQMIDALSATDSTELERVKRERDAARSLLAERICVIGAGPITTAFGLPIDRLRELAEAALQGEREEKQ